MHENVLFVEDERALRMIVGDSLRSAGYFVEYAADGNEAFQKATELSFDLIILDVMLPQKDGFVVCRDIRRAGLTTPILMLTARSETSEKIKGLKIGADDYVTKPFEIPELMARIEALLRRARSSPAINIDIFQFGSVRVDLRGTEVRRDGDVVHLSSLEFQLLRYFILKRGATLSRDELLKQVWGYSESTFTRTVDVTVASLRQKLESDPKQPKFILTAQGLGYRFRP